ncbi:hypothetical protein [Thiothrix nivea]|uniref:Conserved repeat domain-containing protein n=1 Tax=Thiothrix nivea (strain ATCC 35100 / DSM 5205 / JP2) TaxID=870187 RepID=A0A656HG25_THINJ|nr:hypothetical protein [Thiothrix nivea]EIJ34139.1 conserved repeat domain-containing protein [Thiothrix nivea DSM 5205]
MQSRTTLRKLLGLSTSALLLAGNSAWAAQTLEYTIRWDTSDNRYHVFMKPNATPTRDMSLTGQITIIVPHAEGTDKFTVTGKKVPVLDTNWKNDSRVDTPSERPDSDYISFSLSIDEPSAFAWQAGVEQEVLSFNNSATCLGPVSLMDNTDPFMPPNSTNTNPGNQFTNLGWGTAGENNYLGNYDSNIADCRDSLDDDGDGLKNGDERLGGTDPGNPDSDGDGLSDGVEVNTTKTDPKNPDSDGDGIDDKTEVGTDPNNPTNTDSDTLINALDPDDDNDGVLTKNENYNGGTPLDDDTDGDKIPDYLDTDDDGDNIPSASEGNDPNKDGSPADAIDTDGDKIPDYLDKNNTDGPKADPDGDGLTNEQEQALGTDPTKADTDGDGLPDNVEVNTTKTDPTKVDSDGDGIDDKTEVGADPTKPTNSDGDTLINALDPDDDNDGVLTKNENYNGGTPLDDDTDGDKIPDYLDTDDDGDNIPSASEGNDPNKDGSPADATDTDGDKIPDYLDKNSTDGPKADPDGDGLTNEQEQALGTDPTKADTDGDGLPDNVEVNTTKTDPTKVDSDGDGIDDKTEVGIDPTKPTNSDGDTLINALDPDDDNDGVLTKNENYNGGTPLDDDTDGDKIPDYLDTDDDGDNIPTASEGNDPNKDGSPADATDTDGDKIPDYLDKNSTDGPKADPDGDGLTNEQEQALGTDPTKADTDGDGLPDNVEVNTTKTDPTKVDSDGDGIDDKTEVGSDPTKPTNSDGDTLINALDPDDDNDGILTKNENYNGGTPLDDDTDGDKIPDYLDTDDDGDNIPSASEGNDPNKDGSPADATDTDGDNIPDYLDTSPNGVKLQVKVMLQGAYDSTTGMMKDTLRSQGLIPLAQPYNMGIYSYAGKETTTLARLATTGNDAPVDWVLVELRDPTTPTTVKARMAALVQRDGDVMDATTGSTSLLLPGMASGNYYVAIHHRNHLGVMTAGQVNLNTVSPTMVNFIAKTTATWGEYGRYDPSAAGSTALLWAGNANIDKRVIANGQNADTTLILGTVLPLENLSSSTNYRLPGYLTTDTNMDGVTIFAGPYNDVNLLLGDVLMHPNNSLIPNANFIINRQVP